MALAASSHFYFQCEDAPTPEQWLLVDAALFTFAGNLPPSSWFARTFAGPAGGGMRPPAPVATHPTDGRAVYYMPLPRVVMQELLLAMRFPALRDAKRSPRELVRSRAWEEVVTYYGLVPPPLTAGAVVKQAEEELAALEAKKPFQYARLVAEALAAAMVKDHPQYAAFAAGAQSELMCEFCYATAAGTGAPTYTLALPSPLEPVKVANYLGNEVTNMQSAGLFSTGITGRPTWLYVTLCLERALGTPVNVEWSRPLTRLSKSKKDYMAYFWPTGRLTLARGTCEVLQLRLMQARPDHVTVVDRFTKRGTKRAREEEEESC